MAFLATFILGRPAEADSAPSASRIAVIVARGTNVEPTVTKGLALKLVVDGQRINMHNFARPQEVKKHIPAEDDAFYLNCISDDDCLMELNALTGQNLSLLVIVDRTPDRTLRARLAFVSNSPKRILRRAESLREPIDASVANAAWPLVRDGLATAGNESPGSGPPDSAEREDDGTNGKLALRSPDGGRVPQEAALRVNGPTNCVSLDESIPERTEADRTAPFERPWVLVLPIDDAVAKSSMYGPRLAPVLDDLLRRTSHLERFRYVTSCVPPSLTQLHVNIPARVEYIFAPAIRRWEEKSTITKQGTSAWSMEIEAVIDVYRVTKRGLMPAGTAYARVPEWSDSASFFAEATARSASSVGESLVALRDAMNQQVDGGPRTGDAAYDKALEMFVGRLGSKLALGLKRLSSFRLDANVLSRGGDELAMALGSAEGVQISDRFVLVPRTASVDDYVGFGRVYRVGAGGADGVEYPSIVEVVSGDDDDDLRLVEWPQLGISVEAAAGLMSYSHRGLRGLNSRAEQSGTSSALSVALGVGWRLPAIPVTDLSIRADITFGVDFNLVQVPAVPFVVEVGLEKRWSLRRFMPMLGVAFDTAFFAVDADAILGTKNLGLATASALGGTVYGGFALAVTPDLNIRFRGGYRIFPAAAGPVKVENEILTTTLQDVTGAPFEVRFDGPFGLTSFEFVF